MGMVVEYVSTFILYYEMPRDTPKPKPMTTTISLEKAVFKELKHLAVERETTVRELIREAIHQLLKKKEARS